MMLSLWTDYKLPRVNERVWEVEKGENLRQIII